MPNLARRPVKRFRLHSVCVEIHGGGAGSLLEDFDFYTDRPADTQTPERFLVTLEILNRYPQRDDLPLRAAARPFPEGTLYREGRRVYYEFGSAVLVVDYEGSTTLGRLISTDESLVEDIGYRFLQSEVGRFLERENLHRVPGLGIGLPNGDGALLILPRGVEPAALALALVEKGDCVLLSATSPLVDRLGRLYPFPLPLRFSSDAAVGAGWRAQLSPRPSRGPAVLSATALPAAYLPRPQDRFRPRYLVAASRHGGNRSTELSELPRWRGATTLLKSLVAGVGLPGVEESLPDLAGLVDLAPRGPSRLAAATAFVTRAVPLRFQLSLDPAQNAEALLERLGSHGSR